MRVSATAGGAQAAGSRRSGCLLVRHRGPVIGATSIGAPPPNGARCTQRRSPSTRPPQKPRPLWRRHRNSRGGLQCRGLGAHSPRPLPCCPPAESTPPAFAAPALASGASAAPEPAPGCPPPPAVVPARPGPGSVEPPSATRCVPLPPRATLGSKLTAPPIPAAPDSVLAPSPPGGEKRTGADPEQAVSAPTANAACSPTLRAHARGRRERRRRCLLVDTISHRGLANW